MLDWHATEKLSFQVSGTYYGKQEAPKRNNRANEALDKSVQKPVDPYGLVGLSSGYEFNKTSACGWASTTCSTNSCTARVMPMKRGRKPTTKRAGRTLPR